MSQICIVTTAHSPTDVRVTHRIASSFARDGYDVIWIGPSDANSQKLPERVSFSMFPRKKGIIGRVLMNLTLFARLFRYRTSVYFFAVDPDSAITAGIGALFLRTKVIFDIHERYHDDMLSLSHLNRRFLRYVVGRLVWIMMQIGILLSDVVIGVGETRLNPYYVRKRKRVIVRHCVPKTLKSAVLKSRLSDDSYGGDYIMFGKASTYHGTPLMLDVIELLKGRGQINFRVIFFKMGGIQEKASFLEFETIVRERGLEEHVVIMDPVPFEESLRWLSKTKLSVILYPISIGRNMVPNRVFENIAFGVPTVFPDYAVELNSLNREWGIGEAVDITEAGNLATCISSFLNDQEKLRRFSLNCDVAFREELNFEQEFSRLRALLVQ